jgi:hypothetical protein
VFFVFAFRARESLLSTLLNHTYRNLPPPSIRGDANRWNHSQETHQIWHGRFGFGTIERVLPLPGVRIDVKNYGS